MPWPGTSFKKHNHKLSGPQARRAGAQATAILGRGIPEGEAIAIANKHAKTASKSHIKKRPNPLKEHMK